MLCDCTRFIGITERVPSGSRQPRNDPDTTLGSAPAWLATDSTADSAEMLLTGFHCKRRIGLFLSCHVPRRKIDAESSNSPAFHITYWNTCFRKHPHRDPFTR